MTDSPPARRDDTQPLPVVHPGAEEPAAGPAGGRAMSLLVGAAVVVAAAAIGLLIANAALTRTAENAVAERAADALGAPATARLRGWPVGLRLVTGQPVDVVVESTGVRVGEGAARLSRLEVELERVVVDRRALEAGVGRLHAPRGRFAAELDAAAVQELAGPIGRLPLVEVELRDGVARLSVAGFPVVDATVEVVGGQIQFAPTAPVGSFARLSLELGDLPLGFRADRAEIRRGVLRVEGSASDVRLGDSGGSPASRRGVSTNSRSVAPYGLAGVCGTMAGVPTTLSVTALARRLSMCQYEICGCEPVESGALGPRVSTVVDRRVRPSVRLPGDRRGAAVSPAEQEREAAAQRPAHATPSEWAVGPEAHAGSLV